MIIDVIFKKGVFAFLALLNKNHLVCFFLLLFKYKPNVKYGFIYFALVKLFK